MERELRAGISLNIKVITKVILYHILYGNLVRIYLNVLNIQGLI